MAPEERERSGAALQVYSPAISPISSTPALMYAFVCSRPLTVPLPYFCSQVRCLS